MLVQWLHSPGLQLWQGLPALVQGQLHEVQEVVMEQKQQRSWRAAVVFYRLPFSRLTGGALVADEE